MSSLYRAQGSYECMYYAEWTLIIMHCKYSCIHWFYGFKIPSTSYFLADTSYCTGVIQF